MSTPEEITINEVTYVRKAEEKKDEFEASPVIKAILHIANAHTPSGIAEMTVVFTAFCAVVNNYAEELPNFKGLGRKLCELAIKNNFDFEGELKDD